MKRFVAMMPEPGDPQGKPGEGSRKQAGESGSAARLAKAERSAPPRWRANEPKGELVGCRDPRGPGQPELGSPSGWTGPPDRRKEWTGLGRRSPQGLRQPRSESFGRQKAERRQGVPLGTGEDSASTHLAPLFICAPRLAALRRTLILAP